MNTFRSELISTTNLLFLMAQVQVQTMELFGRTSAVLKADDSPVTEADMKNHALLTKELPKLRDLPVFSEENYPAFSERKNFSEYWLIDPLDGTKEFISGVPEFSVLVSLMNAGRPRFAAIQVPALDRLYVAECGRGAFRYSNGTWSRLTGGPAQERVGLTSRFHAEGEVEKFYDQHGIRARLGLGSALKFCALAEGDASVYFRHKGPHEWDVAAGDLLVNEAGGTMARWPDRVPIEYNCEATRVSSFLALAAEVELI